MNRLLLRDDPWERIHDRLPGKASDRGVTAKDNRRFVEAVLWIVRTGAPWRDLPVEFGRWNEVVPALFEEVFLDSRGVLAYQHAAGAQKKPATQRLGARAAA